MLIPAPCATAALAEMRLFRSILVAVLFSGALVVGPGAPPTHADVRSYEIDVKVRPITRFRIGSDQQRFGDLEFVGGLEMNARARPFGAFSGIRFVDGQSRFIGVADTGFWFAGTIERDDEGRPIAIADFTMTEIEDRNGQPFTEKWFADSEGIAMDGDEVIVSFERDHRISRYRVEPDGRLRFVSERAPPVPMHELRRNRGFEAIAKAPNSGTLGGALVGVSEYSLDANRNIMAFATRADGSDFEFSVRKRDGFYITDADFLPDGDLVILERRFNVQDGVAMRLRRIDHAEIVPGATVDGQVLLEADLRYQIDNMEGLAITTDPDGMSRLTLISDDNHSLFQRNLFVEFRLIEPQSAAADG